MNKYLKKALIISASVLMFLSVGAGINNVQARHYHYRYYRHAKHNKCSYWKHHRKHNKSHYYKSHKSRRYRAWCRKQARLRRAKAAAKRRQAAFTRHHINIILSAGGLNPRHHVHHYHILIDGVDDGWTTNYRTYKNSIREIKNEINEKEKQLEDQDKQSQPADTYTDDDTQPGNGVGTGTTPKLTRFAQEVQADTVNDINRDREADGKQPYTEDSELDQVAQIRANQVPMGHYNDQGQVENGVIAQQLGYLPAGPDNFYSENLSGDLIGKDEPLNEAHEGNTSTPRRAADAMEYSFLNYDQDSNNGHRYNILTSDNTKVGVGIHAYTNDSNQSEFSLVEEFE